MNIDALSTVRMPAYSPQAVAGVSGSPERQALVAQRVAVAAQVPVTAAAVGIAASAIESYLKSTGRELEFRVDDDSGQMVVSVRDAATGELIRQIPGEAVLRMARALKEDPVSLISLTV